MKLIPEEDTSWNLRKFSCHWQSKETEVLVCLKVFGKTVIETHQSAITFL